MRIGSNGYQPPMKRHVTGLTTAATTMAAVQAPKRRVMEAESKSAIVNPLDTAAKQTTDVFATFWAKLFHWLSHPAK